MALTFKSIAFTDAPEKNPARFPKFSGFSIEDQPEKPAGRFPQFSGIAIEDFILERLKIKVQDLRGNGIENVKVRIYSLSSPYGHDAFTDENGIVTTLFRPRENQVLELSKGGYKTYRHRFNREETIKWQQTLWPAIPVIVLPGGHTANALNPSSPTNPIYD